MCVCVCVCVCILKENISVVLFRCFYFLEIFCKSSRENCKKFLTVAIVTELICFERSKLNLILKKKIRNLGIPVEQHCT